MFMDVYGQYPQLFDGVSQESCIDSTKSKMIQPASVCACRKICLYLYMNETYIKEIYIYK
jgi:hypothetical protein